jgi:hypothetical protein
VKDEDRFVHLGEFSTSGSMPRAQAMVSQSWFLEPGLGSKQVKRRVSGMGLSKSGRGWARAGWAVTLPPGQVGRVAGVRVDNRFQAVFYLAFGVFGVFIGRLAAFKRYRDRTSRLDEWGFSADSMRWLRRSIAASPLKSKISGIGWVIMGSVCILIGFMGLISPSSV